jgi:hypothetical protein
MGTNRCTNWMASWRNLATVLSDGYILVSIKHKNPLDRNALPSLAPAVSPVVARIDLFR